MIRLLLLPIFGLFFRNLRTFQHCSHNIQVDNFLLLRFWLLLKNEHEIKLSRFVESVHNPEKKTIPIEEVTETKWIADAISEVRHQPPLVPVVKQMKNFSCRINF